MTQDPNFSDVTWLCDLDELPEGHFVKVGDRRWRQATLSEIATAQRDGWPSVYRGGPMTRTEQVATGKLVLEGVPL